VSLSADRAASYHDHAGSRLGQVIGRSAGGAQILRHLRYPELGQCITIDANRSIRVGLCDITGVLELALVLGGLPEPYREIQMIGQITTRLTLIPTTKPCATRQSVLKCQIANKYNARIEVERICEGVVDSDVSRCRQLATRR
jgi:hypothetical protein